MRLHRRSLRRVWQSSPLLLALLQPAVPGALVAEGLSEHEAAVLETLAEQTIAVRGLEALEPLRASVMSVAELQEILLHQINAEFGPARLEGFVIAAQTLGLLPPGYDLVAGLQDLLTEQIGGLYDDESKRLCIMEWINLDSSTARIILVHEMTHALQDQHFGLSESPLRTGGNDDAALATAAVVEGDGMVTMAEWAARHAGIGWMFEIPQLLAMDQSALNRTPRFIQGQLLFPYLSGQRFVMQVRMRGLAQVNRAMEQWPESTEQILHPERSALIGGDVDHPTAVSIEAHAWGVPEEWRRMESNVWGEFTLRQIFEAPLRQRMARRVADGWDGDRWELWRDPASGAAAYLWTSVWDSDEDAAEFADALSPLWESVTLSAVADPESRPAYRSPRVASLLSGATVHVAVWDADGDLRIAPPSAQISRID